MLLWRLLGKFRTLQHKLREMVDIKRDPSKKVISIIGTTGVGKSQLSIELAKKLGGEVINADSMQMYLHLDNITNKHPIREREGIPHHVMNHVNWEEQYYIHRFKTECEEAINDCWNRGKIPIIVGGTHYYLQSVLFDNKTIGSNEEVEEKLKTNDDLSKLTQEQRDILDSGNAEITFNKLKEVDPVIATKFHPNDIRRIRRALEVYYVSGERASSVYERQRDQMNKKGTSLKYDTLFFWVYSKIPELDIRLDQRVDKMMQNGGLHELTELYEFYIRELKKDDNETPKLDTGVWQVIGFKEFLPYLEKFGVEHLNSIDSLKDDEERMKQIDGLINNDKEFKVCCDEMKMKTRRYARKQIKWIKNLLGPELQEEENNGFVKYGKIFVLDATNLDSWFSTVADRGLGITKEFLEYGYVNEKKDDLFRQIPGSLESEALMNSDKKSSQNKTENWVHHQCEICTDRNTGNPLVYVGEQWDIHLKSKKHKFNLNRGKRKREYEEWLEKNKANKFE